MNYSKAFFIILLTVIFALQINQCPSACKCSINSMEQCRICLSITFKRNYSIENNTCPCLENYLQSYPPAAYCSAKNCSLYYQGGCYSCDKNWTTQLLDNWYICDCKTNYYFDPVREDCFCKAQLQIYASQYYQPSKYQCLICPQKCQCNKYGCMECPNQLNRRNTINIRTIWTCYCEDNYKQFSGICVPKQSIVSNCTPPKVAINQQCLCIEPYYLDINNNCVCKSLINPTKYYQYHGVCYTCPEMCDCNQLGCYRCFDSLMQIYENNCTCIKLEGVIYLNGRCTCINPLNIDTCTCASLISPSDFYQDEICHFCPTECICNQHGCGQCHQNSNRNDSCYCKQPFIEIDNKCIECGFNFIYTNNTCKCPNQVTAQISFIIYYFDIDTYTCNKCPNKCDCDETGCYYCYPQQFRKITQNSQNMYLCNCDAQLKFEENLNNNTCQCIYPYTFNSNSSLCECNQPYYINGTECICKSFLNSSEYYLYNYNDCRVCPYQCNCTENGCISCDENQGRTILISNHTYICPCIPIRLNQTRGSCKICLDKQYLWRNKCLYCDQSCATCNQNGCLSCSSSQILKDNKCLCTENDTLNHIQNLNGNCRCINGYFNNIYGKCELCPLKCKSCYFLQLIENIILCSQCNVNVSRINDPQNNCPCVQNYLQNLIISSYCCHYSCAACNSSGCTQCLPFTYRYMNATDPNNIICSCMDSFIQNASRICTCPLQSYLSLNKCISCPNYCSRCFMMTDIDALECICLSGINRINKQHQIYFKFHHYIFQDCICAAGFISVQNSPYCYSKFCSQYGINGTCRTCIKSRALSPDKLYCNCSKGYYQDANKVCQQCSVGCVQCLSHYVCQVCQPAYELISDKEINQAYCIIPNSERNLLYQFDNYTIFQLKSKLIGFTKISMFINLMNSVSNRQSFKIVNIQAQIIQEIIIITFERFRIPEYTPYIIQINLQLNNSITKLYYSQGVMHTKQKLFYSDLKEIFIYLFISLFMLISLILNIVGVKQNDIMFYFQTIYFFAMKVNDPSMLVVPFLSYFQITNFNFSFKSSNSPFDNLLSNWQYYIEYSTGNYQFYTIDSNFLRNAGLALYLVIQNAFLIVLFRIIYYVLYNMKNRKYKNFAQKYKKPIYRLFEWFYKAFMYPVLFYSLSTIICYNTNYSLINQSFRQLNLIISITMIIVYAIVTIIQYIYNQIATIHRYDYIIEFVFEILISIAIVSIQSTPILIVAFLVFAKGCIQFYNYQLWIRIKLRVNHKIILIIIVLIQSSIFVPIYFSNIIATILILVISLCSIVVSKLHLYMRIRMHFRFDKKKYDEKQKQEPEFIELDFNSVEDNSKQTIVMK